MEERTRDYYLRAQSEKRKLIKKKKKPFEIKQSDSKRDVMIIIRIISHEYKFILTII